jgi:hypothetical protein
MARQIVKVQKLVYRKVLYRKASKFWIFLEGNSLGYSISLWIFFLHAFSMKWVTFFLQYSPWIPLPFHSFVEMGEANPFFGSTPLPPPFPVPNAVLNCKSAHTHSSAPSSSSAHSLSQKFPIFALYGPSVHGQNHLLPLFSPFPISTQERGQHSPNMMRRNSVANSVENINFI